MRKDKRADACHCPVCGIVAVNGNHRCKKRHEREFEREELERERRLARRETRRRFGDRLAEAEEMMRDD